MTLSQLLTLEHSSHRPEIDFLLLQLLLHQNSRRRHNNRVPSVLLLPVKRNFQLPYTNVVLLLHVPVKHPRRLKNPNAPLLFLQPLSHLPDRPLYSHGGRSGHS